MENINNYILIIFAFIIVATASGSIARLFLRIKLPLITGFLVVGVIAGPFVTKLITNEAIQSLKFINNIALAFIAYAAGSELYLKDIRSRFKSITWMTFGQLTVTFVGSSIIIFFIADYIPFMKELSTNTKIAISLLIGTIFVARSPASAIAIINELRAKGPFTKTAISVTIVKDLLVIILFTIVFSLSDTLISNTDFNISEIIILFFELTISFALAFLVAKLMEIILSFNLKLYKKSILLLLIGWSSYFLSYFLNDFTTLSFNFKFHIEPLLINIIAAFYITNKTKHRKEFKQIIDKTGLPIYIAFFTITGAAVSLDVLVEFWFIAIVFFLIRLITMIGGSFLGGSIAKDSLLFRQIGWMPFVTQAGVALGLITVIANAYPKWGSTFEAIMIAVIVLNQIIGPPLFKWSIYKVKENHEKAQTPVFDGVRDAIIFGLEDQSVALAKQLIEHSWNVKIAATEQNINHELYPNCEVISINEYSLEEFKKLEIFHAEAIICMETDEENKIICEIAYGNCGTKELIVRLEDHKNYDYFNKIGALVVEPATSIVNLLFHFVRSPIATSILLGQEGDQDTIDLEVINKDLHGLALRDLRLPNDTLILSVKRGGTTVISHGYTRLRLGDLVTLVGSEDSLQKVKLKFE